MPTFTRSAMNPNGSYVSDGMDASDAANFNLQNQRQQQSIMAQLALAQLRSGDARYAAERSDNMGMAGLNTLAALHGQNLQRDMHNQDLGFQGQALDKQYGFLGKNADLEQSRWQAGQDWQKKIYDEGAGPRSTQAQLATAQLQELLDRQNRAKAAQAGGSPYAAKTEAGRTAAQSASLSGAGIGEQGIAARSADIPELQGSADLAAQGVGSDLDVLERKAASIKPWKTVDANDIEAVKQKLFQLQQQYVEAGYRPADAKLKAQNLLRQHMPAQHTILFGDNPTSALYSALGIQGD
jgi:hypothetical protein